MRVVASALRAIAAGGRKQYGETPSRTGCRNLRRATLCGRCPRRLGRGHLRLLATRAQPSPRIDGSSRSHARSAHAAEKKRWPITLPKAAGPPCNGQSSSEKFINRGERPSGWPAQSVAWRWPWHSSGRCGMAAVRPDWWQRGQRSKVRGREAPDHKPRSRVRSRTLHILHPSSLILHPSLLPHPPSSQPAINRPMSSRKTLCSTAIRRTRQRRSICESASVCARHRASERLSWSRRPA